MPGALVMRGGPGDTGAPAIVKREEMRYLADMKSHQHPETERKALCVRVRKIVGQLTGVDRMLEADRDCAEILTQLVSARRAIKSLAEQIIHSHMHHCVETAHGKEDAKEKLREFLTVLERYIE